MILQRSQGAASWRLVGLLLVAGLLASGGAVGWKFWDELRRLQRTRQELATRRSSAEEQLKTLQQQHEQLAREHEQLAKDRDNLLTQTKRAMQERDEAATNYQWLETMFRQAAGERLELIGRLTPLEEQYVELQRDLQQLVQEREQLEQELAKARSRSEEQQLKVALSKERQERQHAEHDLQSAQRSVKDLETRRQRVEERLENLKTRFDALQDHYTGLIAENRTLQHQTHTIPQDVTKLAQEHERLVKEMADTHYNMGVLFAKRRDYARASKEFEKALELRPDDADALYNLGVIYAEHLQDKAKAIKLFRQYLTLNPKGQDASWIKQYIASWHAWEGEERLE